LKGKCLVELTVQGQPERRKMLEGLEAKLKRSVFALSGTLRNSDQTKCGLRSPADARQGVLERAWAHSDRRGRASGRKTSTAIGQTASRERKARVRVARDFFPVCVRKGRDRVWAATPLPPLLSCRAVRNRSTNRQRAKTNWLQTRKPRVAESHGKLGLIRCRATGGSCFTSNFLFLRPIGRN